MSLAGGYPLYCFTCWNWHKACICDPNPTKETMNSVHIIGNLTRDPELRSTPSGTSVCDLRVAVNAREKQGEEWVDRANYFDVTVWGKQADNCATYLGKGKKVAVSGELRWREWETDDGGKRQAVSITARHVEFLTPKSAEADEDIPF